MCNLKSSIPKIVLRTTHCQLSSLAMGGRFQDWLTLLALVGAKRARLLQERRPHTVSNRRLVTRPLVPRGVAVAGFITRGTTMGVAPARCTARVMPTHRLTHVPLYMYSSRITLLTGSANL